MEEYDPEKPQFVNLAPMQERRKKLKRTMKSLPSLHKQAKGLKTYMNLNTVSIIMHILAQTRTFASYFEDGNHVPTLRLRSSRFKGKLAKAFEQYLSYLKLAQLSSYSDLTEVLEIAEFFQPKFKNLKKRDPYDIFDFMIWGLHEECNRAVSTKNKLNKEVVIRDKQRINFKLTREDYVNSEREWGLKKLHNNSHILDTFEGQLMIDMKCYYCSWGYNAYENFTSLSLPFPSEDDDLVNDDRSSIYNNINQFLLNYRVKEKRNEFYCEQCEKQTPYAKTVWFIRLPKILVMRVDRCGKDTDYAHSFEPISFDSSSLNLFEFSVLAHSQHAKYKLYAVVDHYTKNYSSSCYYIKGDEFWYKYYGQGRAEKVTELDSVNNKSAYMFFYVKCD